MCHQFYLTRRITTRRGANFWPRKRTQETHKQTQNSSQEHSHHIWKWLEVIYLPRLSLLADSTHFLCVLGLWCHSLNNRWQQSTVFPDAQVAIASNSLWPCLKYKRELDWPENSNIRACELNVRHPATTHTSRFIISTLFSACSFLKSVFCI